MTRKGIVNKGDIDTCGDRESGGEEADKQAKVRVDVVKIIQKSGKSEDGGSSKDTDKMMVERKEDER